MDETTEREYISLIKWLRDQSSDALYDIRRAWEDAFLVLRKAVQAVNDFRLSLEPWQPPQSRRHPRRYPRWHARKR